MGYIFKTGQWWCYTHNLGSCIIQGLIGLFQVDGFMDSRQYCSILQQFLFPGADRKFRENWSLQQESSAFHSSNYTKEWLDSYELDVL